MNNVVQFPKEKRGGPPQNLEEIQSNIEAVRQLHVEETVSLLAGVIFDNLSLAGFNFNPDNESYTKDVALRWWHRQRRRKWFGEVGGVVGKNRYNLT